MQVSRSSCSQSYYCCVQFHGRRQLHSGVMIVCSTLCWDVALIVIYTITIIISDTMLNITDLLVYWFIGRRIARLSVSTVNGVDMALRWRLMACFGVGWPVCIDTGGTIMYADSTTEILINRQQSR